MAGDTTEVPQAVETIVPMDAGMPAEVEEKDPVTTCTTTQETTVPRTEGGSKRTAEESDGSEEKETKRQKAEEGEDKKEEEKVAEEVKVEEKKAETEPAQPLAASLFGGFGGANKGLGFGSFTGTSTTSGFGLGAGGLKTGGTSYFTNAALKVGVTSTGFSGFGGLSTFSSAQSKDKESEKETVTEENSNEKDTAALSGTEMAFPDNYEYETGEEGEKSVAHCRAKLYHLDLANRNWKSRGEGMLKLNESTGADATGSRKPRLLMWSTGSKRLLLNVRIWDGMSIEKVNEKRLRFVAVETDEEGKPAMNTYLITTSATDADAMLELISTRVKIHA
eukprot:Ihof_evm7s190 gene=Ihof_evmTU7s190